MHGKSYKHSNRRNHIMWAHLVEHSICILHAPTFCIHVNKAIPNKYIWITSALNDLLVHDWPLQVPLYWHMHSATPRKWQCLAAHLPVAFVGIVAMPCPLPHSLHIPISWQFTRTHHARASSRTLPMYPPCSHIWHTYLQSYSPQRHLTCNHFLNCSWKHLPSSSEGTWSTWKASLLTFSNLWSHHREGSENKSCQSCTLWPPGTMQTGEISDKTCHQTADLIHAHANDRTPVFCDPDWHHLFHHLV